MINIRVSRKYLDRLKKMLERARPQTNGFPIGPRLRVYGEMKSRPPTASEKKKWPDADRIIESIKVKNHRWLPAFKMPLAIKKYLADK